jgi:hypothetical protein
LPSGRPWRRRWGRGKASRGAPARAQKAGTTDLDNLSSLSTDAGVDNRESWIHGILSKISLQRRMSRIMFSIWWPKVVLSMKMRRLSRLIAVLACLWRRKTQRFISKGNMPEGKFCP